MKITGHCYCGDLQYEAQGDPIMALQCHCRECQYFTGGNPNASIAMPLDGFRYTSRQPAQFTRTDLDQPVTRDFCGRCGTPLASRAPGLATAIILKVGAMDDNGSQSDRLHKTDIEKNMLEGIDIIEDTSAQLDHGDLVAQPPDPA